MNPSQNIKLAVKMCRLVYGNQKRTVAANCPTHTQTKGAPRKVLATATKSKRCPKRNTLGSQNGRTLDRFARAVSAQQHMPLILPEMFGVRCLRQNTLGSGSGFERTERRQISNGGISILRAVMLFLFNQTPRPNFAVKFLCQAS